MAGGSEMNSRICQLRVGDLIAVRSKEEILATLDKNGRFEEMPFMPEMFQFCGKRFRVYKCAHKTCDTVNNYKGRKVRDAVHLAGVRCDGQSHGGCEANCLIFWKTAWLRSVTSPDRPQTKFRRDGINQPGNGMGNANCLEADVFRDTATSKENAGEPVYSCQATRLPAASEPLAWWHPKQYVEDYMSGNIGIGRMFSGFFYMAYRGAINAGIGLGPFLRWLYDRFQSARGGIPYPRRTGLIPVGELTPAANLDLKPGEYVRVKSYKDILSTLDTDNKNRGLFFDAEMVPYCGGTYKVLRRVQRIINERSGCMTVFKNACIMLESVICQSRYSECRLFCPRSIQSYWREIWLERAASPQEVFLGEQSNSE
jgi:hypothetical protein